MRGEICRVTCIDRYCSVVGLRPSGLFESAIVCSSMYLLEYKPYETNEMLNAPLLCETEP